MHCSGMNVVLPQKNFTVITFFFFLYSFTFPFWKLIPFIIIQWLLKFPLFYYYVYFIHCNSTLLLFPNSDYHNSSSLTSLMVSYFIIIKQEIRGRRQVQVPFSFFASFLSYQGTLDSMSQESLYWETKISKVISLFSRWSEFSKAIRHERIVIQ